MNPYNKLINEISAAQAKDIQTKHSKAPKGRFFGLADVDPAKKEIHSRKVSNATTRIRSRDDANSSEQADANADRELGRDLSNSRRSQLSQQGTQAKFTTNLYTHKVPGADGKPVRARIRVAASTELDWTNKLVEMITIKRD